MKLYMLIGNDVEITWLDFEGILWKFDVVMALCSTGYFDLVSKISQKVFSWGIEILNTVEDDV